METPSVPHTIERSWTVTEAVPPPGMIELHIGTPGRTYAVVYADKANRLECEVARQTARLIAEAPENAKRLDAALDALRTLYTYEARRSDSDTAWERPMMANARAVLGRTE